MYWKRRLPTPTSIFFEDWDNLIILDGCRFDMFEQVNDIHGDLIKRVSKASWTPGFLRHNLENRDLSDVVYITANPIYAADRWYQGDIRNNFHDIVDVWKEHWDESAGTVQPQTMAGKTLDAYNQFPNKRIIAHFIQPHIPFIGDTQLSIDEIGMRSKDVALNDDPFNDSGYQAWEAAEIGEVDMDTLTDAYYDNLRVVLKHIEPTIRSMEGRTVITSDHGNCLGELQYPIPIRHYGHPKNVFTPELREVPWLRITNGRKKTYSDDNNSKLGPDENEEITQRLQDLGYK